MKIAGIIPARYASTRFPGKPLVDLAGQSLIQRVYLQAQQCKQLQQVVVATDDNRIADHVRSFGGQVIMTSESHQNGTERCAEAASMLGTDVDAVINIQGDEPFIQPQQIALVANTLLQKPDGVATLIKPLPDKASIENSHVVKAVVSNAGKALYFSRLPIPFCRDGDTQQTYYKHLGIYGYTTKLLQHLVLLPVSSLEESEKLEQLRWLQHDINVYTEVTEYESLAIDRPEDVAAVCQFLNQKV